MEYMVKAAQAAALNGAIIGQNAIFSAAGFSAQQVGGQANGTFADAAMSAAGNIASYVAENPGSSAAILAGVAVAAAPGIVVAPALAGAEFTAQGVGAGTAAAGVQSYFAAAVPAGGWFATLTSAGAGGYGAAVVNGVVQGGGALSAAGGAAGAGNAVVNGTVSWIKSML